jgi:YD repeat-containing protein
MQTMVYDPVTLRLMAEHDDRNFSTIYEYDDEGTLVRTHKETEKGIYTIRETRSGLRK